MTAVKQALSIAGPPPLGSVSVRTSLNSILKPRQSSIMYDATWPNIPNAPATSNQLARLIVGIASGEVVEDKPTPLISAREFIRSGGLNGGAARREALTPERRTEIALQAARKRWGKKECGRRTTLSGRVFLG